MTNAVRQAIAASITPDLVREACDEARVRAGTRVEDFYGHLALALKRRVAAPLPEATEWAVVLVAIDGGVRALLNTAGTRFLEPRGVHDDMASGAFALWFSIHHESEIAPFATREAAQAALENVLRTIGQPGLRERLRIVPAGRRGEQELLVHMSAKSPEEATRKPEAFLATNVFQAYVDPAKPA
jgi:hypothetical protein